MTLEEALRFIDPETDMDALAEVEYYNGFKGKEAAAKTLREASQMVVDFVRRMQWHDTKTDPPKKEDSDHDGKVLVWHKDLWTASMSPWYFTANRPDYYPYWMPLPEPPLGKPSRSDPGRALMGHNPKPQTGGEQMFVLEYKQLHIVKEPMRKNCTCQSYRWKQYAMCEDRQPLQDIIDKQPRPDEWRIEEYPN